MRSITPLLLVITVFLAWTANAVQAQTYFYLGQIAVMPAEPTDQDQVQLQLIGNLSSTGSSITSATAAVNGYTINLTLVTQNTIGMDVIVPHTESVQLGLLSAGTYTVNIIGFGVDDLAPPGEHVFTVSGSIFPCDSLVLASLTWSPFNDTTLLVHIFNPTATLFDYPNFVLLADNGDTLAKETINTFGIGQDNYNTLDIPVGTNMPQSPFSATLQLFSGGQFACSWDLPVDLCPPGDCSPVVVELRNFSSTIATGSFEYTIRKNGTVILSGLFELTDEQQFDEDTVCLAPGQYIMEVVPQQGPNGGQPDFGPRLTPMILGPHAPVMWTTLSAVAFSFYEQCVEIGQGISEPEKGILQISRSATSTEVYTSDGGAIGKILVFDAQGRIIASQDEFGSRHTFHTEAWSPGLYLLQARKTDGHVMTVRFVIG